MQYTGTDMNTKKNNPKRPPAISKRKLPDLEIKIIIIIIIISNYNNYQFKHNSYLQYFHLFQSFVSYFLDRNFNFLSVKQQNPMISIYLNTLSV